MGWLPAKPYPGTVSRHVWGCIECQKPMGTGKGTIRFQHRYMIEEDVAVWGDDP